MTAAGGFLAIWSDVPESEETNYLHWLAREHAAERLGVPGFLKVRVFRARSERPRYFILYRLERPDTIRSGPYLDRLNAPSAWSRRIMPNLQNFVRGGGRVAAEAGQGDGSIVMPIVCAPSHMAAARDALAPIAALDRIVAARLFEVDQAGTAAETKERSMRTGDRTFSALLTIEGVDGPALEGAADVLRKAVPTTVPLMRYDQIFALDRNGIVQETG